MFFVQHAFLVCKLTNVYITNRITDIIIEVISDKSFEEQ